jgi:curved DNA-binding protein CbpA
MRTSYDVLGVAKDADADTIKNAYRRRAKACHPDLNPGHRNAAQQFVDVATAYDLLSDPRRRAVYDCELQIAVARRREAHGRLVKLWAARCVAVAGAAVSVLVTSYWLGIAVRTGRDDIPVQPTDAQAAFVDRRDPVGYRDASASDAADAGSMAPSAPARVVTQDTGAAMASVEANHRDQRTWAPDEPASAAAPQPAAGKEGDRPDQGSGLAVAVHEPREWKTYRDDRFAYSLSYPAGVFTTEKASPSRSDQVLWSSEAGARLVAAARPRNGESIASYRRSIIESRYASATFDYAPVRDTWFVLSGTRGQEMFYERVSFACGGDAILSWQMTYRTADRKRFDPIVEEIHRKYRYHADRGACARAS